jgi:adenylate cyclase
MPLLRPPRAALRMSRSRTRGRPARRSYALAVLLPIVVIVSLGLTKSPSLPDLSSLLFDWYQRLDPREWDANAPVRIIDIDDESLARVGQWPWPRSTIAEVVRRLGALDAAAVAFDIVFAEPDNLSPEQVISFLPSSPARALLEEEIRAQKTNDAMLAASIVATPTVLGAILTQGAHAVDYPAKHGVATAGDDPRPLLPHFTSAVLPLPILSSAGIGLGALNWLPDRDQVVRRVPLVLSLRDQIVTSLALESLRVVQNASSVVVRSSNASGYSAFGAHTGVNTIKVGEFEIPTDPQGELRVRYSRNEPHRLIPAWKLLAGEIDRDDIQGRIIFVGISAAGLSDQHATPVDPSVPGTEIHAQAVEQIVAGSWLVRPDWMPGAELVLAVVLALAFAMALPRTTVLPGAVAMGATIAILGWTSWYQFSAHGLLADPILPSFSVAITYISCMAWLYRDEQRQRREVRDAFGRYVSPAVVARLADDPAKLVLGGESRILTILFCDIRGFTAIAETLDAQHLSQLMNEYLTPMTEAILANGGTIDKYIGDAVMAFWNAPLDDPHHATHASQATLAMTRELDALNQRWRSRAEERGRTHHDIKFGIGLATGDCHVGNFGSAHRFDYSALGDCVNLASRLEGATKYYQTDILGSEATRNLSADLAWLEVDCVRLQGKSKAARIFMLAGDEVTRRSSAFAILADLHDRMLAAYRCGNFHEAAAMADKARAAASPARHDFYLSYMRRCHLLAQSRPADWTAVTELTMK